ncbi:MAG: prepilin-type N-terminal cleavage/methylation domain-containing protein [Planctomycetota bacterium]
MKKSSAAATTVAAWRRRESGYTILELAVVIVIIGIMAASTLMELDGVTPKYRLRGAAREIGTRINWARAIAGGSGGTFYLHYDLDRGKIWLIHPPKEDESEDTPLEQRHKSSRYEVPTGVLLTTVLLANGDRVTDGGVDLEFDPFGHGGSHIVYLENDVGGIVAVKFNSILGFVNYHDSPIEFEVLR